MRWSWVEITTTRSPDGQLAQQPQHLLDLDVVEVRGRLVGEEQRRVERERPRDRDPLLLTARQVAGTVVHAVAETDLLEQLGRARAPLRPRAPSPRAQRDLDVLERGEARHQVERLEHDADGVAPVLGELRALEPGDRRRRRSGSFPRSA